MIMILFAASIFLSSFLLFQIEPMIGKVILPWFGGTPAVWSTLMLIFQVLLTGGYAYATWLIRRVKHTTLVHMALLLFALSVIGIRGFAAESPILPSISASIQNTNSPVLEIIKALSSSIALPFFILASNGPLMQAWFSRVFQNRSYARLYALSNIGSLLGLLTYPILTEPNFTLQLQGQIWFMGFLFFGLSTCWIAFYSGRAAMGHFGTWLPDSVKATGSPSFSLMLLWILLGATASLFLLSVTNQISQEVAVIPFLWILPLTIYLFSFIVTFSDERLYNRRVYSYLFIVSAIALLFVMLNATTLHIYWQILAYGLLLFITCILCHGELYLLRPSAEHLTSFYFMVSIGGAFGGIFAGLIAPVIFNGYWEFFVGLAMMISIVFTILRSNPDNSARARFVFTVFILVTAMLTVLSTYFSGALFTKRNFYGVIRVRELVANGSDEPAYVMSHGITVHGLQFINPELRDLPTTYYGKEAGGGLAILNHPRYRKGLRVGMLGVGAGTLTTYGQPGDSYRLYEINPVVIGLAEGQGGYFSFVRDSQADVMIIPGDARISLQRELEQGKAWNFDVLVLDTFSSDAIPVHLLTREAFAIYLAHLAPDGIIAAHVTNLHLDLQPVFWRLANYYDLGMVQVNYAGDSSGGYASHWILLSPEPALLQIPAIQAHSVHVNGNSTNIQLWTDDYSNLFQILK